MSRKVLCSRMSCETSKIRLKPSIIGKNETAWCPVVNQNLKPNKLFFNLRQYPKRKAMKERRPRCKNVEIWWDPHFSNCFLLRYWPKFKETFTEDCNFSLQQETCSLLFFWTLRWFCTVFFQNEFFSKINFFSKMNFFSKLILSSNDFLLAAIIC